MGVKGGEGEGWGCEGRGEGEGEGSSGGRVKPLVAKWSGINTSFINSS